MPTTTRHCTPSSGFNFLSELKLHLGQKATKRQKSSIRCQDFKLLDNYPGWVSDETEAGNNFLIIYK